MKTPPADIFIWGVHPSTTPEDIVEDLAASDIKIVAADIEKKSKQDAACNSYRISVPAHDLQKDLDPGIWPLRVKVRKYVYYSKKKDSAQQQQQISQSSQETSRGMQKDLQQNSLVPSVILELTVSNMYDVLSNVDAAGNPL